MEGMARMESGRLLKEELQIALTSADNLYILVRVSDRDGFQIETEGF